MSVRKKNVSGPSQKLGLSIRERSEKRASESCLLGGGRGRSPGGSTIQASPKMGEKGKRGWVMKLIPLKPNKKTRVGGGKGERRRTVCYAYSFKGRDRIKCDAKGGRT